MTFFKLLTTNGETSTGDIVEADANCVWLDVAHKGVESYEWTEVESITRCEISTIPGSAGAEDQS